MSKQFMLLESNPEMGLRDGIYQDITEPYRDATLPNNLRQALLESFMAAEDKSLFSPSLEVLCESAELKLALAPGRFNFLQNFDLGGVQSVLDLTQDYAGVSHFIADHVGQVESVKIDPGHAEIALKRCANKHNICHISADLETLTFPNNHYDLIIIGQLEALQLAALPLSLLLKKLQRALRDNGVLVLSGVNNNRINRWLEPQSTNTLDTLEFSDLYTPKGKSDVVVEVDRKLIRDTLLENDFASVDIHACFANNDECKAVFSEDYLTASVNAINHFYDLGSIKNPDINEFLVFDRLVNEKQNLVDYASHFLVLAGANSAALRSLYDNDFSHFSSSDLKPKHRASTSRRRSAHLVDKRQTQFQLKSPRNLTANTFEPQPFQKGRLLVRDWLQALLDQDHRQFSVLVEEYQQWLSTNELSLDPQNRFFDLEPSKVIVNQRGDTRRLEPISKQLTLTIELDEAITPDFLLFRALFWFAQENRSLLRRYAITQDTCSVGLFIVECMPNMYQIDELIPMAKLEEQIQSGIRKDAINGVISRALTEPLTLNEGEQSGGTDAQLSAIEDTETLTKLINAQNTSIVGQSHRLTQLRNDIEHQTQRISDLQDHRAEMVKRLKDQKKQKQVADDLEVILRSEIDELHERLHVQNVRNAELHGYLLMRPTTRATRVARRTLSRLTGKALEVDQPAINVEPEVVEEVEAPATNQELIGQNKEDYQQWISENTLSEAQIEAAKADIETMAIKPVFSILVPIYDTEPEYLLPMIESVQKQIYPHWQLCLVDDCSPKPYLKPILEHQARLDDRIVIQLNNVNQGISVTTNDALAMASGDYIALLDHDDEISIDALYQNAKAINANPNVGLIYSDEDKIDMKGQRVEPYFKPDYSPDLLHTNNYICHFTVIKKDLATELGGFREGLDGSQDHDIIIRSAAAAEQIVHIPKILYHWRKIPGSTAVTYDSKSYAWEAGRKAVEDQLKKDETGVSVEFGSLKGTYRVFREIKGRPLVSIVIPFKDKPELLDSCLNSILNRTSYASFEIVGVSNNSDQALTFERMTHFSERDERIRFVEKNVPFNFSTICNFGVEQAKGEYIVLLNNDIEIISPDWIERLLEHAQRDEIGAVGGKLLYPDGRIQHAGVVAGMVGAAGHPHKFFPDDHIGYHGRLHMVYNVSAVTGAMMMIKTEKYKSVGGLDEDNLAVAYNDIDLCLKLLDQGYLNIFTPHSKATHHESISRGYEDTDEKVQRLLKEQQHFLNKWSAFLDSGDPYYNPNLSLKNERFSLKFKD